MDAQDQFHLLQNGTRTTSLDSVKTIILMSAIFWNNFAAVTQLYADFVKQVDVKNTIKIASLD